MLDKAWSNDASLRPDSARRPVVLTSALIGIAAVLYAVASPAFFGYVPLTNYFFGAIGLAILAALLLAVSGRLSRSYLIAFAIFNVAILGLFLWSLSANIPVSAKVQGTTLVGKAGGKSLTVRDISLPGKNAGLYLPAFNGSRTFAGNYDSSSNILSRLSRLSARTYPREGWTEITVRSESGTAPVPGSALLGDGKPVSGDWYADEGGALTARDGGLLTFDTGRPGNLRIAGVLERAGIASGIAVGVNDSGDGYVFTVDTERERLDWYQLNGGQLSKSIASTQYRHDFTGLLQALVERVALIYFYALGLFVSAGALLLAITWLIGLFFKGQASAQVERPGNVLRLWPGAAAGVIAAVSMTLSSAVALGPLQGIPHVQDEVAYLFQAKTFALGRLFVPPASYPEFFQNPFILTYNGQWFSKYPPGHSIILAVGVILGQPWIVGPALGALSLVAVYLTAKEMWDARTGLIAAFLGMLSPFVIFMSASYLAHTTTMFFVALFVLAYVKAIRRGGGSWAVLAGAALGMAFITRQLTAVGVAAPFVVFALLEMRRDWRFTLRQSLLIVAGFVPIFLFLMFYNRALTGSPLLFPHNLVGSYDAIGFGPGIGGVAEGHTPAQAIWNTQRNLEALMTFLYGWPAYLTFGLISLPFLLRKARKWDYLMLGGFLAIVGAYILWWAVALIFGPRYWYETLPFLLLLSGRGLAVLYEFLLDLGASIRRNASKSASALAAGVAVCSLLGVLLYYNIGLYLPHQWQEYTGYNDINREPIAAVQQAGISNALVFYRPLAAISNRGYGPVFAENSPLLDSDIIYARDLGPEKDRALIAIFPGRKVYLLDQTHLSELR